MVEALFRTLVPTPMLPSSACPLHVPPTHNGFNPSFKKSRRNLKLETPQYHGLSAVSTCEQNFHLHDWPQLLQSSIGSQDYMLAQAIHGYLIKSGCEGDLFVDNNLVNLYSKFNKMGNAQRIFDEMLVRSTVTWTTLMKGYLKSGDLQSVFHIALDMCMLGEMFNEHTCSVVLQACKSPEDHVFGEQIHAFVIKNGLQENVVVATSLVSMYSRSGHLGHAEKVFTGTSVKDAQCINYMILEYGKAGLGDKAFQIFVDMLNSGLNPSDYTFTNLIVACNLSIGMYIGKQLHGLAVKYGFMRETSFVNAVITMYGQHGMVKEAERVFFEMDERSLISWSALLSAFVKNGYANRALEFFLNMLQIDMPLDSGCFSTVLDGCSECNNLKFGLQIHGLTIKLGHVSDINCGTSLVDLYAKCRSLQSARAIFDRLPNKTIASFNAILIGYLNSKIRDDEEDPMAFFSKLRFNGVRPDMVTFSRLLSLCANQACLVAGKSLHAYTIKVGLEDYTAVGNAVITMYAKCGSVHDAYQIFSCMNRDHVTWNAIISAYAVNGEGNNALLLFEDMKGQGFAPDEITILAVLQACSYSCLWEIGLCLFNEMEPKYGIRPVIEHYSCVIDLLGRAGNLSKAIDIINKCPFSESSLLWRTLVNACKLCGDLQLGMWASKKLLDLAPNEASSYILVSNMYAEGGMPEEAAKVRTAMNDLKLIKETGSSWIEVENVVHYFIASDKDHPKSREIYAYLDLLTDEIYWSCENKNNLQLLSVT
ncbi:pentatricopeptide repeat-containing protein At2g33680-like [Gastrolobium bilobum]|uniref:pentatricopeptide repeat-containing protein At2g33680-like n=1 Tax=Gastrolobium bilobum TaxID=150636 RepID=UPI002AB02DE9|nr:pentatricopeptide repeat-containing protein At2g33680-like [Gastrolobium bilobum]